MGQLHFNGTTRKISIGISPLGDTSGVRDQALYLPESIVWSSVDSLSYQGLEHHMIHIYLYGIKSRIGNRSKGICSHTLPNTRWNLIWEESSCSQQHFRFSGQLAYLVLTLLPPEEKVWAGCGEYYSIF